MPPPRRRVDNARESIGVGPSDGRCNPRRTQGLRRTATPHATTARLNSDEENQPGEDPNPDAADRFAIAVDSGDRVRESFDLLLASSPKP